MVGNKRDSAYDFTKGVTYKSRYYAQQGEGIDTPPASQEQGHFQPHPHQLGMMNIGSPGPGGTGDPPGLPIHTQMKVADPHLTGKGSPGHVYQPYKEDRFGDLRVDDRYLHAMGESTSSLPPQYMKPLGYGGLALQDHKGKMGDPHFSARDGHVFPPFKTETYGGYVPGPGPQYMKQSYMYGGLAFQEKLKVQPVHHSAGKDTLGHVFPPFKDEGYSDRIMHEKHLLALGEASTHAPQYSNPNSYIYGNPQTLQDKIKMTDVLVTGKDISSHTFDGNNEHGVPGKNLNDFAVGAASSHAINALQYLKQSGYGSAPTLQDKVGMPGIHDPGENSSGQLFQTKDDIEHRVAGVYPHISPPGGIPFGSAPLKQHMLGGLTRDNDPKLTDVPEMARDRSSPLSQPHVGSGFDRNTSSPPEYEKRIGFQPNKGGGNGVFPPGPAPTFEKEGSEVGLHVTNEMQETDYPEKDEDASTSCVFQPYKGDGDYVSNPSPESGKGKGDGGLATLGREQKSDSQGRARDGDDAPRQEKKGSDEEDESSGDSDDDSSSDSEDDSEEGSHSEDSDAASEEDPSSKSPRQKKVSTGEISNKLPRHKEGPASVAKETLSQSLGHKEEEDAAADGNKEATLPNKGDMSSVKHETVSDSHIAEQGTPSPEPMRDDASTMKEPAEEDPPFGSVVPEKEIPRKVLPYKKSIVDLSTKRTALQSTDRNNVTPLLHYKKRKINIDQDATSSQPHVAEKSNVISQSGKNTIDSEEMETDVAGQDEVSKEGADDDNAAEQIPITDVHIVEYSPIKVPHYKKRKLVADVPEPEGSKDEGSIKRKRARPVRRAAARRIVEEPEERPRDPRLRPRRKRTLIIKFAEPEQETRSVRGGRKQARPMKVKTEKEPAMPRVRKQRGRTVKKEKAEEQEPKVRRPRGRPRQLQRSGKPRRYVLKGRRAKRVEFQWKDMPITYICKVCEFRPCSPGIACMHLLLEHQQITKPLYQYLTTATVPGTQRTLHNFILEDLKIADIDGSYPEAPSLEGDDENIMVIGGMEEEMKQEADERTQALTNAQALTNEKPGNYKLTNQGQAHDGVNLGQSSSHLMTAQQGTTENTATIKIEPLVEGGHVKTGGVKKEGEGSSEAKPFKENSLLELHDFVLLLVRWVELNAVCPKCNRKQRGRKMTNVHHCIAMGARKLCETCGQYIHNHSFKTHMQREHGQKIKEAKRVVCPHCQKEMSTTTISHHIKTFHKGTMVKVPCGICGRLLSSNHSLRRHEAIHRTDVRYNCPICKRGFTQSTNMKNHMRQHTGEQPYKCEHCNKSFTHKVSLKTHLLKQHGIDLWKLGHTGCGRPKKETLALECGTFAQQIREDH